MNLVLEPTSTLPHQPRWQRYLVPSVVTIHVLLFIGLWYGSRSPQESLPVWMNWFFQFSIGYVLEACIFAQPLLLSAWLLWGRTHLAVRLCAFAAFPWALFWCCGGGRLTVDAYVMGRILETFSIPIAIVGLIRLIGYQLVDLQFPIEARPYQFSIRHLLLVSFLFGAWLSVVRWSIDGQWKLLDPGFSHTEIFQLAAIELLATITLVAGLIDGKWVRLILVLGLLGMALPIVDESLHSEYDMALKYGLETSAIVFCSVLPFRLAGYRLRRVTTT